MRAQDTFSNCLKQKKIFLKVLKSASGIRGNNHLMLNKSGLVQSGIRNCI